MSDRDYKSVGDIAREILAGSRFAEPLHESGGHFRIVPESTKVQGVGGHTIQKTYVIYRLGAQGAESYSRVGQAPTREAAKAIVKAKGGVVEEYKAGAGEEGTPELTKTLKRDTPGQCPCGDPQCKCGPDCDCDPKDLNELMTLNKAVEKKRQDPRIGPHDNRLKQLIQKNQEIRRRRESRRTSAAIQSSLTGQKPNLTAKHAAKRWSTRMQNRPTKKYTVEDVAAITDNNSAVITPNAATSNNGVRYVSPPRKGEPRSYGARQVHDWHRRNWKAQVSRKVIDEEKLAPKARSGRKEKRNRMMEAVFMAWLEKTNPLTHKKITDKLKDE